ncbi:hypothetical protein ACFOJE_02445 [Azotobacter bryophylli]|uniref:Uncharacterized protein n=1 Tax=Azotobacter bryophylli TaxID=1986537 RepID=A0ABV7AQU0_9GAMM
MAMLLDTLESGRERRPDETGTRPARPEFGSEAGTGRLAGYALW